MPAPTAPAIEKIYNDGFEISFPTPTVSPSQYNVYLNSKLFKTYFKGGFTNGFDIPTGLIATTFIRVTDVSMNYFAAPISVTYTIVSGGQEGSQSAASTVAPNVNNSISLTANSPATLIPAIPNLRYNVVKLTVSNSAASDAILTISDGTATKYGPVYLAASGGGDEAVWPASAPLLQSVGGLAWTATATQTGVTVNVEAIADLS
jgi:hypothetical protein